MITLPSFLIYSVIGIQLLLIYLLLKIRGENSVHEELVYRTQMDLNKQLTQQHDFVRQQLSNLAIKLNEISDSHEAQKKHLFNLQENLAVASIVH